MVLFGGVVFLSWLVSCLYDFIFIILILGLLFCCDLRLVEVFWIILVGGEVDLLVEMVMVLYFFLGVGWGWFIIEKIFVLDGNYFNV